MVEADPDIPKPAAVPGMQKRAKATASSRYLIPLATAMLLGVCFAVFYLTYVQQHREYLLNRNYRVLATLGEQMSETLANQTATLTSYVNSFEGGEFNETMKSIATVSRTHGDPQDKPIKLERDLQDDNLRFKICHPISNGNGWSLTRNPYNCGCTRAPTVPILALYRTFPKEPSKATW
jgi:hypothetical protein